MSTASRAARHIMRAIRVREFGGVDKLVCEKDVPIPTPAENEVLIKVSAAGVNPVDTYIRSGNYAALPTLPYTPGQDTAGVVEEVGCKVTEYKKGDRVVTCRTTSGAYAEYATAPTLYVSRLKPELSFAQGAGIGVPYFTAYRALMNKAQAKPGQTVLIHGASGAVGLAALQIAKANGLKVLGTAGSADGLKLVQSQGAEFAFNHKSEGYTDDIVKATGGQGPDIILEMLANVNLETDLKLVAVAGTIVVIGCRGSVEINPRLAMGKEASIKGVMLMRATEAEWHEMKSALENGQSVGWIRPQIARTYSLNQASQAQADVITNQGALGKLVLDMLN